MFCSLPTACNVHRQFHGRIIIIKRIWNVNNESTKRNKGKFCVLISLRDERKKRRKMATGRR